MRSIPPAMLLRVMVALLIAAATLAVPVAAQPVGQAIAVVPSAQVSSGGVARRLDVGGMVASGDIIQTGARGQVQLLFIDETRIVVGPNSALTISDALFRRNGTASSFAVAALGGTFRFISGTSPRRVYRIATPTATMGIRGTAFDISVRGRDSTGLLVFEGRVRLCADGQRCALVPGRCQAVSVSRDDVFRQPQTPAEKAQWLRAQFPLALAQQGLSAPFRTSTAGCAAANLIRLPPTRAVVPPADGGRTRSERAAAPDNTPAGPPETAAGSSDTPAATPSDQPSGPAGDSEPTDDPSDPDGGGNPAEGPSDPGGDSGNPAE